MKSLILTSVCLFVAVTLYSQKVRNTVCVIQDGRLMNAIIDSITPAGEKLIYINKSWKKLDEVYPLLSKDYAGGTTWFTKNEPLFFDDTTFAKFEKERVLSDGMEKVGSINGVGAYVDILEAPQDRLLYIPVQRGCVFQGYREGLPPCKYSILISPHLTEVKRGTELVLSASLTGPIGKADLVEYKWNVDGTDSFGKSLIIGSAAQQSIKLSTNLGQSILKDVLWIFLRITINKQCSSEGQVRIKVVN